MKKGIFWYINGTIVAFPETNRSIHPECFTAPDICFNHKRIWKEFHPVSGNIPYNYYPRGRVDTDNKKRPVIYVNPNIDATALEQITKVFELDENYRVVYDASAHYLCYLDKGWRPDDS